MVDRIRQLMESGELSPSQFADKIEVPRATVSHILSGRNKPSLEVTQRILQAFPDLDPGWFVLGKATPPTALAKAAERSPELDPPRGKPDKPEEEQTEKVQVPGPGRPAKQLPVQQQKKVERIIFFYSDTSFREYLPEAEN